MKRSERKKITDIVNAFKDINKDIRNSFDIMSEKLKKENDFKKWKKQEKGVKPTVEGYQDFTNFLTDSADENWYYLNYYGLYGNKVIGFTFVISLDYDEKTDINYCEFMDKLDKDVNKNTPMLCIKGVYTLKDETQDANFLSDGYIYVDDTIRLTENWKNYDIDKITYDKWIDVEMDYELIEDYEGWYKEASVKIVNITDISSKEKAHAIIDDLIVQVKNKQT